MISQALFEIGSKARSRRKTLNYTQAEAARMIQAHRNEISRIENGKYTGNIATMARYLNLLGLSLTAQVSKHPELEDLDQIFNVETD